MARGGEGSRLSRGADYPERDGYDSEGAIEERRPLPARGWARDRIGDYDLDPDLDIGPEPTLGQGSFGRGGVDRARGASREDKGDDERYRGRDDRARESSRRDRGLEEEEERAVGDRSRPAGRSEHMSREASYRDLHDDGEGAPKRLSDKGGIRIVSQRACRREGYNGDDGTRGQYSGDEGARKRYSGDEGSRDPRAYKGRHADDRCVAHSGYLLQSMYAAEYILEEPLLPSSGSSLPPPPPNTLITFLVPASPHGSLPDSL